MTDRTTLAAKRQFLETVLKSAGQIVRQGYAARNERVFTMKGPQDFLTETDAASERHIRAAIEAAWPGEAVFGEEAGGRTGGRCWVVDPIDGTANFARGVPHFCISIGYVEDRLPLLAGIYNPVSEELYIAERGRGAWMNGRPLSVSPICDPAAASVEMGWSTRIGNGRYIEGLSALLAAGVNVRRAGSGALALARVADGRSDAYAELHMNAWDCIPGLLLVEEAGGRVCRFAEEGALEEGGPVLAAAPGIADLASGCLGMALLAPREGIAEAV
ncbi:inositol monophosphatase [Poseidonocella sp. HB161398]|uniref:inositol monophosphatase family protein n=1 Tax=Poseidonocella sp. HB161398 TaxID=2320855 RepID=UPI001107BC14|nr:inositol monophosphatase [Poseidonocella sp. HB161398]